MSNVSLRRLLAAALAFFSGLPGVATAATQCINASAPAPLEICVYDDGTPAVWVDQPNGRTYQYYSESDWGSKVLLTDGGTTHGISTGYFNNSGMPIAPVTNDLTGDGSAADPHVITTVLDLGTTSVRLTQRFTYIDGDRTIRKTWSLENLTPGTTFTDLRFMHGGDTYFGGNDSARSWWDADNQMVYVSNEDFTNSGFMGFFANPATPVSAYMGGRYSDVYTAASNGQLPNTTDSNFIDAGYALQWNRASLAPGQTWTVEGFETWSPPGALQVIAPADEYVLAGATIDRLFKVHNLDPAPLTASLEAASLPAGWNATLLGAATVDLAGLEVAVVPVRVEVPAGTPGGTTRSIQVSAIGGSYSSAAPSRLTVLQVDYVFSPESLLFEGLQVGQSSTQTITLENGATASPLEIGELGAGNGLDAPFSITADACSHRTLNAGESCTMQVTYTRPAVSASADTFSWPLVAPIITTRTISVASSAEHTVDATAGPGGNISPASTQVSGGGTASFMLTADPGHHVAIVLGCAGSLAGNTYTTGPIASACTVTASFEIDTYTVSAAAGAGGSVGPGAITLAYGDVASFTVIPATNHSIESVEGCGGSLSGDTYTTAPLTGACAVAATFSRDLTTVLVTTRGQGDGGGGSIDVLFLLMLLAALLLWWSRTALRNARWAPIALAVTAAVAFTSQSGDATASESDGGGLHVGMRTGMARGDIDELEVNSRLAAEGINASADVDDLERTAWQLTATYDFTPHFGLAVGYTRLGEVTMQIAGDVVDVERTLEAANRVHPHSADGLELTAIGRFRLFRRLFVTGRVGALHWESRYRAWNVDERFRADSESGTDGLYGLGLELPVFSRWRVLADYNRYRIDDETIEFAGIGLAFRIH